METNLEASKTLLLKAFGASKIALTKARLLKHDFPVHGYLRLVFFAYGGLFCLRLKFGLVFFAYGGKSAWSFLLTVPLVRKIGFGLFCLRFPHRK